LRGTLKQRVGRAGVELPVDREEGRGLEARDRVERAAVVAAGDGVGGQVAVGGEALLGDARVQGGRAAGDGAGRGDGPQRRDGAAGAR